MGIDYGQLLSESERENEELFDALQGHIIDVKYCMPSQSAPRRQLHSKEWINAKKESLDKFMEIYVRLKTNNEIVFVK